MAGYDVSVGKDLLPGLLSDRTVERSGRAGEAGGSGAEPDSGGAGDGGVGGRAAREKRGSAGIPQWYASADALHARGAGDAAGAANAGWHVLDGHLQALPGEASKRLFWR